MYSSPSSLLRWYFGKIKRIEAEKKLLLPQNEHGAYLIRDSESRRNDYSLSVRDGDTVKHYRIRQLDEGGFFIARRTTFRTLQELVEHYGHDADGLCVNLRAPCVQVCIDRFYQLSWFLTLQNQHCFIHILHNYYLVKKTKIDSCKGINFGFIKFIPILSSSALLIFDPSLIPFII